MMSRLWYIIGSPDKSGISPILECGKKRVGTLEGRGTGEHAYRASCGTVSVYARTAVDAVKILSCCDNVWYVETS